MSASIDKLYFQTKDEKAILSNQYGSDRYAQFVQNLGQLLRLKDCTSNLTYIGGLDVSGNDGQYTYGYQDEATQSRGNMIVFISSNHLSHSMYSL